MFDGERIMELKPIPSRHKCLDCGNVVRLSRRDLWKAARPHCTACGSTRLEPVEPKKKGEEEKKEDAATVD